MADRFEYITFGDCNIDDSFFDSLKADYPEFSEWFQRKAQEKESAYVYRENNKIYAFGYLKDENEEINLSDNILPMENRLKIGTLKIEETLRGKRLGEGILGIALWQWQETGFNQEYVTVFEKHQSLIQLLDKFGFKDSGINLNGEHVFIKDKRHLEYSTPYKSFPFINPKFRKAGMLPIYDEYHDTLFPYSKLARKNQETLNLAVANGISKVYIGYPKDINLSYTENQPIFVYRIDKKNQPKTFHSTITSFCTIVQYIVVKNRGSANMSEKEFLLLVGNKTLFSETKLKQLYNNRTNLIMVEMLYNGFFGEGNNVNHHWLKENGYFEVHPYHIELNQAAFRHILRKGEKNEQDIIID